MLPMAVTSPQYRKENKMWYVFNAEDSWEHGFVVSSEKEAIEICKDDETGMTVYRYVDAQAEY